MEEEMVHVPPGPFIFAWEKQTSLRVAMLEQGFWIDRYPVTNQQFREFLNARENEQTGGVEWLDHQWSRIKKRGEFVVEPGYEQHPVTGVRWHWAAAYAAWAM